MCVCVCVCVCVGERKCDTPRSEDNPMQKQLSFTTHSVDVGQHMDDHLCISGQPVFRGVALRPVGEDPLALLRGAHPEPSLPQPRGEDEDRAPEKVPVHGCHWEGVSSLCVQDFIVFTGQKPLPRSPLRIPLVSTREY